MRVPTGRFGYSTPGVAPVADTSAVSEAAVRLGRTITANAIEDRAVQSRERQALARLKATNTVQENSERIRAAQDELDAALDAGRVTPDEARRRLQSKLGTLPEPDLTDADSLTRESIGTAMRLHRDGAVRTFEERLRVRQGRTAFTQGELAWDKVLRRAAAGDDPTELERAADGIANLMRESGAPAEDVAIARERLAPRLWAVHADRRVQDARGNLTALEQLRNDLSASDGRLVTRLDPNDATRLLRSVVAEEDRIEAEMERAAERARREAIENEQRLQVEQMLVSGMPFDPKNGEHRKYVDSLFAGAVKENELEVGSDEWEQTAVDLTQRTRVLPRTVEGYLRQAARSPTPALVANAAELYDQVAAASPEAIGQLDEDTRAHLGMIVSMMRAGTPAARAAETARQLTFDAPREVLERRRSEYGKLATGNASALSDRIDRDLDTAWKAQPAPSAMLSADFEGQVSRYYAKTGDIDLARDLAWTDLQRVYGESRVNGDPVVMPFPPERFGVGADEVRADVAEFLSANPQADGSTAADVLVVPDALTLRAMRDALTGAPIRPSYSLVTKSGDLVVDRHGVPQRYTVPDAEQLRRRHEARIAETEAEAMAVARSAQQNARDASELLSRSIHDERRVSPQLRGR